MVVIAATNRLELANYSVIELPSMEACGVIQGIREYNRETEVRRKKIENEK